MAAHSLAAFPGLLPCRGLSARHPFTALRIRCKSNWWISEGTP